MELKGPFSLPEGGHKAVKASSKNASRNVVPTFQPFCIRALAEGSNPTPRKSAETHEDALHPSSTDESLEMAESQLLTVCNEISRPTPCTLTRVHHPLSLMAGKLSV